LPTLDAVIPPQGRLQGGDSISFHGDYFTAGSDVTVGGKSAAPLTLVGHEALLGTLPPGDDVGPVDVVIRTAFGESKFPGAFTYASTPPPIFIRGDANLDRKVEITDPIAILGELFLGDPPANCLDASDFNDDGVLDISDPVGLLTFLFAGGDPPPPPSPDPGPDPTGHSLGCEQGLTAP